MSFRRIVVVVCLSLLTLAPRHALADTESELTTLEEQRREAIRAKDFASLSRIYAPTFVAVAGNGQLIDRDQLFKVFAATDPTLSFKTDEIRVLAEGDTAVFFGRLSAYTPEGKVAFASRFSHVFVKQAGRWVCIAGQSTPLPATRGAS